MLKTVAPLYQQAFLINFLIASKGWGGCHVPGAVFSHARQRTGSLAMSGTLLPPPNSLHLPSAGDGGQKAEGWPTSKDITP